VNPISELIADAAAAIDGAAESLRIGMEELEKDDVTYQDISAVMAVTENLALLAIARTLFVIATDRMRPDKIVTSI
jgi:hypothetical protein